MDTTTIKQLNQLNLDFYATVAKNFDSSRQYYWKGWSQILPFLDNLSDIRVADVGCGNGRFGQFLFEHLQKKLVSYTGIDANPALLEKTEENLEGKIPAVHLFKKDILKELQFQTPFNFLEKKFDLIGIFGVMHHIPSYELRKKLLINLIDLLEKDGILAISFWQFLSSPRIAKKAQNSTAVFEKLGIDTQQVETNDYILDWKRGTTALRYCHLVDTQEQEKLLQDLQKKYPNLKLLKTYFADGKEGNINSYIILQKT